MFSLVRKISSAAITAIRGKHSLPKLAFDYNALQPIISEQTMELHHSKHHKTYIDNLNAAEEQLAEAREKNDVNKIIALEPALRFNGGGHINHAIFWANLSCRRTKPTQELLDAIEAQFSSIPSLQKQMNAMTVAIQGSGWGWLAYNKNTGKLQIATMKNQDPLLATTGLVPLLGIDVWEHAYYLTFKNVRANYVEAIWDILNWEDASVRFKAACKKSCK